MLRRRDWVNLNGEWEFGAGDERVFDRTITVPFCPKSELSGVGQTDLSRWTHLDPRRHRAVKRDFRELVLPIGRPNHALHRIARL